MTPPNILPAQRRKVQVQAQQRQSAGRAPSVRGANPFGQYQSPGGYGRQPMEPSWNGPRNAAGMPITKGVTSLDSAKIMNDFENGSGTSAAQAGQADMAAQADKLKNATAFEKGYENYRRSQGFGVQPDAGPAPTPEQAQRSNLIKGGVQPYEADEAIAQAKAPVAAPVTPPVVTPPPAPGAVKPPAPPTPPVVAPDPATITDKGITGSMSDWIAQNKARQADPSSIGPDASIPPPSLAMNDDDSDDTKAQGMKKGGKVIGLDKAKNKMRPKARADGGPVGGVTDWNGSATRYPTAVPVKKGGKVIGREDGGTVKIGGQATQLALDRVNGVPSPLDKTVTRAKGGPAPTGPTYKVGETGPDKKPKPELFMPHDKSAPSVIGAKGQEVGKFKKSGVVIPNHALQAMKAKFGKSNPAMSGGGVGDSDDANAPTDPHELPTVNPPEPDEDATPLKHGGLAKAKEKMRPKKAA